MKIITKLFYAGFLLMFFSFSSLVSDAGSLRILFVGNSLTYTNDLPALVQEIGKQDSVTIDVTSLCFPNYSLEDHWNDGHVQKAIEENRYDFVIAHQGPSAMPESQVLLTEYAKKIGALCEKYQTRFCLFTVWPSKARSFDLDAVISSYKKAAVETRSLLASVGSAWKEVWKSEPGLSLYGPDNFHPSFHGSLLAAITIYGVIKPKTNFNFLYAADTSWKTFVTTEQVKLFISAALSVLRTSF